MITAYSNEKLVVPHKSFLFLLMEQP